MQTIFLLLSKAAAAQNIEIEITYAVFCKQLLIDFL
jgi:hypothetical protein